MKAQSRRKVGVLVINFGEPDEPTMERVVPFLERIFLQNAGLEPDEAAVTRAHQLAVDRAPGLVREYERIGGSPLNAQADAQASSLELELVGRGFDARTYSAFQFAPPFIRDEVARAHGDDVESLVALPVYPICGRSTTVAAIEAVRAALDEMQWAPKLSCVSGWHHHSAYGDLRTDHVAEYLDSENLDLRNPDTLLYFSVHGTPIKYLDEGNRYDRYVEEHCRRIAERLDADRYAVGFQNHTNRRIEWTQPDNEDRIRDAAEHRLVVVPVSFMHEQSETLVELDEDLRAFAEGVGKEFHRVPVPHDSKRFTIFLADLVAQVIEDPEGGPEPLARCRCVGVDETWCSNGSRDLPPSPFVPRRG